MPKKACQQRARPRLRPGRPRTRPIPRTNLAAFTAQMIATRLQALFGPLTDLLEVVGVLLEIGLAVWELANQRITIIGGLLHRHPRAEAGRRRGSGAGKSTLAKLLLRSYDPDSGTITLDGIDLRELALADLYRNIATVLQETLVFDATIHDNILWGKPEATPQVTTPTQVTVAAQAAHEFIAALPEGYHTRVGQRGRMLSGGQRQRLAIARAMIRDAPILLLDELTTGLDAESSRRVLTPLCRLMAGRTIIISHNLLTVTDADQILFLDHGDLIGTGSHTRLLNTLPTTPTSSACTTHPPPPLPSHRGTQTPALITPAPRTAPRSTAPRTSSAVPRVLETTDLELDRVRYPKPAA